MGVCCLCLTLLKVCNNYLSIIYGSIFKIKFNSVFNPKMLVAKT